MAAPLLARGNPIQTGSLGPSEIFLLSVEFISPGRHLFSRFGTTPAVPFPVDPVRHRLLAKKFSAVRNAKVGSTSAQFIAAEGTAGNGDDWGTDFFRRSNVGRRIADEAGAGLRAELPRNVI